MTGVVSAILKKILTPDRQGQHEMVLYSDGLWMLRRIMITVPADVMVKELIFLLRSLRSSFGSDRAGIMLSGLVGWSDR